MECPRGSVVSESEHKVTTLDKAREWWPECKSVPIVINQRKASNGRLMISVYRSGQLMFRRG